MAKRKSEHEYNQQGDRFVELYNRAVRSGNATQLNRARRAFEASYNRANDIRRSASYKRISPSSVEVKMGENVNDVMARMRTAQNRASNKKYSTSTNAVHARNQRAMGKVGG